MNPETIHNIPIDNAGLVILNPFLITLFDQLNYLQNGSFVNNNTQLRAAQLLQYAVTGAPVLKEANLVLNKVLCDLPDATLFPVDFIPTKEETLITENCMEAVLHYWDKLKNTSVQGIRESFLKRDGVLFLKEPVCTLRVEKRGYDLLLQTIPWQISPIRLPWMKGRLIVEWI